MPTLRHEPTDAQHARWYAVLAAHDARFDGRLFVGVTSTGVYCRPICRVRTPRRENCRFFANAASAEHAGFRPCLRCRPELAPGLSLMDSSRALALHAARQLDTALPGSDAGRVAQVAARLGVTDRHLRRIFQQAHGVSPIDYLTTQRLLRAKQLLTDTRLPVTQVALASGFDSLRRFNAVFAQRYRLSPSALRRAHDTKTVDAEPGGALTLRLGYRPPLDAAALLAFFAQRALPGIERVEGRGLLRTLSLPHQGAWLHGWIHARFDTVATSRSSATTPELRLDVAPSLVPALAALLQRVRAAFDLDADPAAIATMLRRLARDVQRPAAARRRVGLGLRLPGAFDGFEVAVRVVLGQQVTVAAARTLTLRLVERFGRPIDTPFEGLSRLFPTAHALAEADAEAIGTLGIVRQRVKALQALAGAVHGGALHLDGSAPLEATLDALRALPGIGEWTAQMIAMRVLGWPDAFPSTDIGVLNALGTRAPREAEHRAEAWRPWRSYAVIRLWQDLEMPA